MTKKLKVVDVNQETIPQTEEVKEEVIEQQVEQVEEPVDPIVEKVEQEVEQPVEPLVEDQPTKIEKPKKMVTCPECSKTMLEKTFRYKHINICSKPKIPRAKPIEVLVEEKKAIQTKTKPKAKPKPKANIVRATTEPIIKPKIEVPTTIQQPAAIEQPVDYLALRREYNNKLKERKTLLVKKLVSKAF